MKEQRRRAPAVEVEIGSILPEMRRVRVLGTIVDRDSAGGTALLDDGTGRAVLLFSDPEVFEQVQEGRRVRVIGRPRVEEGVVIEVEVVQDMERLEPGLYEQVKYAVESLSKEAET